MSKKRFNLKEGIYIVLIRKEEEILIRASDSETGYTLCDSVRGEIHTNYIPHHPYKGETK